MGVLQDGVEEAAGGDLRHEVGDELQEPLAVGDAELGVCVCVFVLVRPSVFSAVLN